MIVADLNGDAVSDLAVANDASTISLFFGEGSAGTGSGAFRFGAELDPGGEALGIVAGDFNADRIRDLAVANGSSGTFSVLLGQGAGGVADGSFGPPEPFLAGFSIEALVRGDFNGDGMDDLACMDAGLRTIHVMIGNGSEGHGDGTFRSGPSCGLSAAANRIVVADMNGDDITDLVATCRGVGKLAVLLGRGAYGIGDATFAPPVYSATNAVPVGLAVADFNEDGIPDVAVAEQSGGGIQVFLGAGNGAFASPVAFAAGFSLASVLAFDANDDGILDLVAAAAPGGEIVLLEGTGANGSGDGAFGVPLVQGATGPYPLDLALGDFNDDGAQDVVSACYSATSGVSISLGRCALEPRALAPELLSARDQPCDPGGQVRLRWRRSDWGGFEGTRLSCYRVWRRVLPGGDWEPVRDVAPEDLEINSVIAPTTRDSLGGDKALHEFFVQARTSTPEVFFDSRALAAYSVYNPCPACTALTSTFHAADDLGAVTVERAAARFDTSFYRLTISHSGGFDIPSGMVWADAGVSSGFASSSTETHARDIFFLAGLNTQEPVSFTAQFTISVSLQSICGVHCSGAGAGGRITEIGGSTIEGNHNGVLQIPVTRRPAEPFQLELLTWAGATAQVYGAHASAHGRLSFVDLPNGGYVRSCYGYWGDIAVPVLLSLVEAKAGPDAALLTWYSNDRSVPAATVYRRAPHLDWSALGQVLADGTGRIVYEDHDVVPGARYGYRLGVLDGEVERMLGEAWVEIPVSSLLGLEPVSPNPAPEAMSVRFTLSSARPAWLEVFDLDGRQVLRRDVGTLGAGRHELRLEQMRGLPAGVYVVRLTQDGQHLSRRVAAIR